MDSQTVEKGPRGHSEEPKATKNLFESLEILRGACPEPEPRFFAEFTLRFFTSFRMTGEGLRMTLKARISAAC